MIDIADLPAGVTLTSSDFVFTAGNTTTPGSWSAAPSPAAITIRRGAGVGGSDRVEITWADGSIAQEWLKVQVLADANTGLAGTDVFYFGNAIAEVNNLAGDTTVNGLDESAISASNTASALITNHYDVNRDGVVDSTDQAIARANPAGFSNKLKLFAVPTATRNSYMAYYYDPADRLTASVNVGTNGGTAYTRPASIPAASDTVLVDSDGYLADDIQTVTITGTPTGGSFQLIFNGHTTGAIAYNAAASTVQSDLAGLTGIGSGNIAVTGGAGGPYTIRFMGTLDGLHEGPITATSSLTGGSSPGVTAVTLVPGGNSGMQETEIDPRGIVSKTDFDLLGRTLETIAAFTDGVPSDADDQTTAYTYDGNGDVLTQTAVMPVGTNNQTTAYIYGVGSTLGTDLFSDDLIDKLEYPDPSTGAASGSSSNDQIYTYDWQGEQTTLGDQNGSVHTYTYDLLGRMTLDAVTTLGSGVDGTIRALGYSFDTGGRPYQDTSYGADSGSTIFSLLSITHSGTTATATMGSNVFSVGDSVTIDGATPSDYNGIFTVTAVNTGSHTFSYTMLTTPGSNASGTLTAIATVANQVQYAYEGWGQEAIEYQAVIGAVNTGSTPSVEYVYTEDAGGQNNDRLMAMIYPNGRVLDYLYGAAEYPLSSLTHSGTTATATMGSNVYSIGQSVTISGADQSAYNGTFTVTAVNTGSHTFNYTMLSTPGSNATGADLIVTTPANTLDGNISRISDIMDHAGTSAGVHLEEYGYLGLSTIVLENRPEDNTELTYVQVPGDTLSSSDGGDVYTGFDRFGRVIDQYWLNTASSPNAIDRFQYGYDRDGNVLDENNLVNGAFSELFHANSSTSGDNNTAYDPLDRLTSFLRGTLTSSGNNGASLDTITNANVNSTFSDSAATWTLNAVGDWTSSASGIGTGTSTAPTLSSTSRSENAQNEISTVGGSGLTYDNNGNLTKNDQGDTLTYDAWNRLMTSSSGSGNTYGYDALGRRIVATPTGGSTSTFYYDGGGQLLQTNTSGTLAEQQVWGIAYVNALILRDRVASGGGNYGLASSGLDERMYADQDANWNVTSLYQVNGSPGVAQRIIYDPYGTPTLLSSAWASYSGTALNFHVLYQGEYQVPEANVYIMGARVYDYTLGAWDQKDPAGYVNGADAYEAFGSNPVNHIDPHGTDFIAIGDNPAKGVWGFWHYSLTYWADCKRGPTSEVDVQKWKAGDGKCARQLESIELWNEGDWYEWVPNFPWFFGPTTWKKTTVNVSVIHFATGTNPKVASNPTNILALVDDFDSIGVIKDTWARMKDLASVYPYAEQNGTQVAKRWPMSLYEHALGNNSNTFAKWLVNKASIPWQGLSLNHPGNDWPSDYFGWDPKTVNYGEVPTKSPFVPMPTAPPVVKR